MESTSHLSQWSDDIERMLRSAAARHDNLVRYIMSYGEEYDDVLQHLRIQIWMRLSEYNGRYNLSTFIFTLVKHELLRRVTYINRIRRAGWRDRVSLEVESDDGGLETLQLEDPRQRVDDELLRDEMLARLRRELSARFQEYEVEVFLSSLLGECDFVLSPRKRARMMRIARAVASTYLEEAYNV